MLNPLPYHKKVKNYFREQSKTWDYFAGSKNKEEQLIQFKTELLKNTYKFDPSTDAMIYDKVTIAKEKLDLQQLPVTVYQAQYADELNASIVFLNNEAHIVFCGPMLKILDDQELLAVIAHELTHIKLYTTLDGELEVADRIITSIANNYNSEAAYFETARLFKLYTEIFCDRGAYRVLGNADAVISCLLKVSTGLEKINSENYIKQSEEIFAVDNTTKTQGSTHPENYIRARSLQLWHEKQEGAEEDITAMIEGKMELDQLDIFRQEELAALTRKILQLYLKPKWFQSSLVISLAKQYFPDFSLDENIVLNEQLINTINKSHISIKEYLGYLLLDFAFADPSLESIPFGRAFQFAEDIQLKEVFDPIVKKELKLSDKKLLQHKQKSLDAYYQVKESEVEQIYE